MADDTYNHLSPLGRIQNAMIDYLPGYATERENFLRRVREGGPNGQDIAQAVLNAMSAVGAGPRPGVFGRAAIMERIPQADPAVTGGGSRFDPAVVRNSSGELVSRPGVESAADIRLRYADPPRRERRAVANDNASGPVGVQSRR